MQTKKERSKDWFEPNVFWCLYLPFNQIKALKKVGLATPTRTKENINNWVAVWWLLTNQASGKGKVWAATMCYTCLHSWPWLAFQTSTAMISLSNGLQKDCYAKAVPVVCCCHHNQCGLNFHSLHTAVLLCIYTLSPFFASDATSAQGALLGEHPPCKPHEEGRPCGRHMGQVEHNFGGFPEIKQHSIGFVDD